MSWDTALAMSQHKDNCAMSYDMDALVCTCGASARPARTLCGDTLPPAVQAVLEAAVAWFRVRQPLDAYRLDTTPERRLALAVDAYRTTLEPSESGWRVVELSSEARVTPLPKEPE